MPSSVERGGGNARLGLTRKFSSSLLDLGAIERDIPDKVVGAAARADLGRPRVLLLQRLEAAGVGESEPKFGGSTERVTLP